MTQALNYAIHIACVSKILETSQAMFLHQRKKIISYGTCRKTGFSNMQHDLCEQKNIGNDRCDLPSDSC